MDDQGRLKNEFELQQQEIEVFRIKQQEFDGVIMTKNSLIAQLEASKEEIEEQLFVAERDLYDKINDFKDFRLSIIDQAKTKVPENQSDVSVDRDRREKSASFARARTSFQEKR